MKCVYVCKYPTLTILPTCFPNFKKKVVFFFRNNFFLKNETTLANKEKLKEKGTM